MKFVLLAVLAGCVTNEMGGDFEEGVAMQAATACPAAGVWCQEVSPAGTTTLRGVWAASADDVFAVGDAGTILRRTNDAWTAMTSNTAGNLHSVWGTSASDIWAGGTSGALVHFDGQTWSPVTGLATDINAIWGSGRDDVWFVGQGAVQHWIGGGFAAQTSFGFELLSISGTGPSDVWVTGEATNVRRWNGSTWATLSAGVGASMMAILAITPSDVWVSDFNTKKETSHWNGSAWTIRPTSLAIFNGMSALGTNDVWGAGNAGKIGRWNGSAWSTPEVPFGTGILWAIATRPGHAWVVGSAGVIGHRTL